MKATDLERIRTGRLTAWRPDMECADCLGPPSCPELTDELWGQLWRSQQPAAPRRCNCVRWSGYRRLTHRVAVGSEMHWHLCDLARPHRRPLLCLECAERRLGRRLSLADLKPCLGNYHVAVETVRHGLAMLTVARGEFRAAFGRDPVEPSEYGAVDARARALVDGRVTDVRIAPDTSVASPSVEDQLASAARVALRELGLTAPDWRQASALCKIVWDRMPGIRHICMTRRFRTISGSASEQLGLQATLNGESHDIPWPSLSPCDDLDEFFDRELDGARAQAFRDHLPGCERCTRVLEGRMHEMTVIHASGDDDEAIRLIASLQGGLSTSRAIVVDAAIADAGILPWMEYSAADLDLAISELRRRRRTLDSPPAPGELTRLDGPTLSWLRAIVVAWTTDDPKPSQTRTDALELIDRLYAELISRGDDA